MDITQKLRSNNAS